MKNNHSFTNNKIKGVILDMDGTILDSMWVWDEIDIQSLGKRGFDVPDDYVKDIAHMGARQTAEYTISRFGLNEKPEALINEWMDMAREKYRSEIKCKPFVKDFLKGMKSRGIHISLATSSEKELAELALKNNNIIDYFDSIVTSSMVKRGKGFPDIYEKAAKDMNLKNSECMVVEDIFEGIKGAKAGGFYAVGIYEERSKHDHDLMRATADMCISSFKELL